MWVGHDLLLVGWFGFAVFFVAVVVAVGCVVALPCSALVRGRRVVDGARRFSGRTLRLFLGVGFAVWVTALVLDPSVLHDRLTAVLPALWVTAVCVHLLITRTLPKALKMRCGEKHETQLC